MKEKLTVRTVEAVIPGERDVVVWDTDIPGLGLKVTPKGRRSFFLYYRTVDHAQRRPLIGNFPAIRPEQARSIAKDWLAEVRGGGDPSASRRHKRAVRGEGTVADLFADYQKDKASLRSMGEIGRIFDRDILPTIGKQRAEEVTRSDVTRLLDKLAQRSPVVASNARKRLSAFYSWALPRLPDGAGNPVTGAISVAPPQSRSRVLSDSEIRTLWSVLESEQEPWRTALRLMILTGQRRGEVFEANWSEFDLDAGLWTIPAERAKNGKAHIVPLSRPAIDLLRGRPRSGPVSLTPDKAKWFANVTGRTADEVAGARWREIDLGGAVWRLSKKRSAGGRVEEVPLPADAVEMLGVCLCNGLLFPGGDRAFSWAARRIRTALDDKLTEPAAPWSWHDIRRTVATGLQRLGVRLEVTEAVLNHVSGTRAGIVGVYQRYDWLDEKRAALDAWARVVLPEVGGNNVVKFRA